MVYLHQLPNELIFKILNFCDNTTLYTIRKLPELRHYLNEIEKSIEKNNVLTINYHTTILQNYLHKWMINDNIGYFNKYLFSKTSEEYSGYIEDMKKQFSNGIKTIVNNKLPPNKLLVEYKKLLNPAEDYDDHHWRCSSNYKQKILRRQLRYLLMMEKFG